MHVVLGAPGSGKTTITRKVADLLPAWIVLDWDGLMVPAGMLAETDIRQTESAWSSYAELIRSVVENVGAERVVLFGVRTPDEMVGWPDSKWLLLDCGDAERVSRLRSRGEPDEGISEAVADAADYRRLGLFNIDSTGLRPDDVAQQVAARILSSG